MAEKKTKSKADVGVLVCDCAGTLSKALDFERLVKTVSDIPGVVSVKQESRLCDPKQCALAVGSVVKKGARRLVVAGCPDEIVEQSLQSALKKSRINRGLAWCVNIREHCAWLSPRRPAATRAAVNVITAAVRRVRVQQQIGSTTAEMNQDVVVLGGGVAGMQSAVALSQLGHRVTLVHKGTTLGGRAVAMPEFYGYIDSDAATASAAVHGTLDRLVRTVTSDKSIMVCPDSSLKSADGRVGQFRLVISSNGTERVLAAGGLVLAVGSFTEFPFASLRLTGSRRFTDLDGLARMLQGPCELQRVAIVMDMLDEQGRAVNALVLSAAEMLAARFGAEVKLYCHHIRVAATGLERLYRRARAAGVVVVKCDTNPTFSEESYGVTVTVDDPVADATVSEMFDLVVMADRPPHRSELDDAINHLQKSDEGALQYDNIWLMPVSANVPGVFTVGDCRGNSELREAVSDASAAAGELHELLKNETIDVLEDAAVVDPDKCVSCLTCLRICPHGAIGINPTNRTALVSPVVCQRCGICAAECPVGAIQLTGYTDEEMAADLGESPPVAVFACENSALPAAAAAGAIRSTCQTHAVLTRVPCAGKVDMRQVLSALEQGAEKVVILGCHPESCHYLTGSTRAEKRIQRMHKALEQAGYDTSRLSFGGLAAVEPYRFVKYMNDLAGGVKT